jgi:hypothetical protein
LLFAFCAFALAASRAAVPQTPPLTAPIASADLRSQQCEQRVNDTLGKLEECIRSDRLWRYPAGFTATGERILANASF